MNIAVVIPCRNEVLYIEDTIHAIYNSNLPDNINIEVFVVDGMSDDGTREKVHLLSNSYSNLKLVDNKKRLTPFAFNIGIKAAGLTDFIQIVGARHILSTNYIFNCLNKLQSDKSIWCVGGRVENQYVNEVSQFISLAMASSFGVGLGNFRTLKRSCFTDTVTSPMYPYWVFEKIGFFDEELVRNQDDEFNYRVKLKAGKIFYDNDISLKYYVRGTLNNLWRQFFQYGYWKVYVNVKHSNVTTVRQLLPPLFVLYLMLFMFTLIIGKLVFLISSIPFLLYIFSSLFFSLKLANSIRKVFLTFIIFKILHISYGFGYLKGIVEFVILNKKPSDNQKRLSR